MSEKRTIPSVCKYCGKEFLTWKSNIKRGWGSFCSRSCSTTYRNTKYGGAGNPNYKGGISKDFYRYKRIQIERYPERVAARDKVSKAIRSNKLKRQPCQTCGSKQNVTAHHEDYSRSLDVTWLCAKCHRDKHKNREMALARV